MLPNCSWRMESTFHTVEEKAWGFNMRMEQPLWGMEVDRNVQTLRADTQKFTGKGKEWLKSTLCIYKFSGIAYLVEVPHCVGQSSPRRVVRLPYTISVAGDVQVHTILDVFLAMTCILLAAHLFSIFFNVVAIVLKKFRDTSEQHMRLHWKWQSTLELFRHGRKKLIYFVDHKDTWSSKGTLPGYWK